MHAEQSRKVVGPLKTWYDLHEALGHEVRGLADQATAIAAGDLAAFSKRFEAFDSELRHHSEVEDGIMFPAIVAAGGTVPLHLLDEHREEQLRVYELGAAIMAAKGRGDHESLAALAPLAASLSDSLLAHLQAEEDEVLGEVDELFSSDQQSQLLRTIIASMPPDPVMQPWVAAALTPEHLEARLRNMATSLGHDALVGVLTQIHDGVDAATWAEVQRRTPDLAALVPAS
ncbi:MAG: hemerythrin domain-containing protein [Acidimicrobiia bacterium]